MVMGILKLHLNLLIQYHEKMYGLHGGRGTGDAYIKAKLLQKLTATREDSLYEVLLDLKKSYYALDWGR